MAPRTVPLTSTSWQSCKNHPSLTAIVNALSMEICSFCVSWSMKRSAHPMESQYVVPCCHAWALVSCVPPVNAHSRAIAAAVTSASNWSCWVSVIYQNGPASDLGRGAQNWGKNFVSPLPLLRERVHYIISLPRKPLAISLHVCSQKYLHAFSCRVNASQCLDGVIAGLAEVWFFHPVVLSVIDSAQSSGLRCPPMMSIHGVIIAVRNSSRLFDARKSRLSGILKHHTKPWLL